MDLSVLSPEAQSVIASADFDKIVDLAERVRGQNHQVDQILQQVVESLRNWSDFEVAAGPAHIEQGVQLVIAHALERHRIRLPAPRARDLVRLVYMFEQSFGFDPVKFLDWLLKRALEHVQKGHT
jgi:uncharacterized HAD superfamily protein